MASATAASTFPRARGFQFRLGTLLVAMVWIGVACAALATPTRFWVGVVFVIAVSALSLSLLLVIHRRGAIQAFAIGFLIFGGAYQACFWLIEDKTVNGPYAEYKLPTTRVIGWLYMQYHPRITVLAPGSDMSLGGMMAPSVPPLPVRVPRYLHQHFSDAAQYVLVMLLGLMGGTVSRFLYLTRPEDEPRRSPEERQT
jgi:hypothetical protein